MIEIKNTKAYNFQGAFHGMRHPLNSYQQADSSYFADGSFRVVGSKDLELATKLVLAGSDHRKFMRQIFVSMDITAPLYWWKEMDTYKVATAANSTSTMHTIHKTPITRELFSTDFLDGFDIERFDDFLAYIESLRLEFLETKNKQTWYKIIQMLPASFNQTRSWTANYETLRNIYHARNQHKQVEWHSFCQEILKLPVSSLITVVKESKNDTA